MGTTPQSRWPTSRSLHCCPSAPAPAPPVWNRAPCGCGRSPTAARHWGSAAPPCAQCRLQAPATQAGMVRDLLTPIDREACDDQIRPAWCSPRAPINLPLPHMGRPQDILDARHSICQLPKTSAGCPPQKLQPCFWLGSSRQDDLGFRSCVSCAAPCSMRQTCNVCKCAGCLLTAQRLHEKPRAL